jgi:hypothetical protein
MPEPTLRQLQRWMSLVVRHRGDSDSASHTAAARALIPRGSVLAGEVIKPSATMPPLARLDVYGGAYLTRLREVLESDFDALRHALGPEDFAALAADYVYAHPSRHPNLNVFGAGLPELVAARADLPHREFLAELADLQWTVAESFAAPEFTPLDVEALRGLSHEQWAAVVFAPNPSVRLRRYRYPVNGFLQAFFDGREPAVPAPADHHLVVYRKAGTVWRVVLPAPIAAILAALLAGEPFGRALERAGDGEVDVGPWFQEWSADGLFVNVGY